MRSRQLGVGYCLLLAVLHGRPAGAADFWWTGDVSGAWTASTSVGGVITNTNWATSALGAVDTRALPSSGDVARLAATGAARLDMTVSGSVALTGLTAEPNLLSNVSVTGGSLTLGATGVRADAPVTLTIGSQLVSGTGTHRFAANHAGSRVVVLSALAGPAGLSKTGPGELRLGGQASYSGATSISDGVVALDTGGGLPAGTDLMIAQGSFDLAGQSTTVNHLAFGSSTLTGQRSLVNGRGPAALTVSGEIRYDGSSNSDGTPTGAAGVISAPIVLSAGTHRISNPNGKIANAFYDIVVSAAVSGAGGLDKTGNFFNVALTQANSYGGPTVISGGVLFAAANGALPAATALRVNGGVLRLDPTSDSGGVTPGSYGQTVASLEGTGGRIDLGEAVLSVGDGSNKSYAGTITGVGGGIVKRGTGTLSLSRAGTYTGETRVQAGRLVLGASFVTGDVITVNPGAVLELAAGGGSVIKATGLSLGGTLSLNDNDFLLDYTGQSPLAELLGHYLSGRIVTKTDAGGLPTFLGIAEAADLGMTEFAGVSVDETAVVLKHTYVGDANLDGQVDALDYERIDLGIGNTGVLGAVRGDVNYDGRVDALDYEQIDLNIGNGVGAGLAAAMTTQRVVVPEPGVIVPVMVLMLAGRRRGACLR